MSTPMNSVSSRMLAHIQRLELGMFGKAAAEVSDAAMVGGTAQPGGPPPAEPSASEALLMMSQDPQVDPSTRTFMMEAADRIRQVDAPLPPPQAQAQPQMPPQAQPQQVPGAEPQIPAAPDESSMAEAKAASLRDSLDDFADTVNSNSNGKIAQSKIIEERILNLLRNPTHY